MTELDKKICEAFPGVVVRKDLVKEVKGNAIVPNYVLEYLLGQYCATSDEASIQTGIESVRNILREHYVHRNEAGLVRSIIREKGRHKVIDKISVTLNDREDVYEASFSNLGISKVLVAPDTIRNCWSTESGASRRWNICRRKIKISVPGFWIPSSRFSCRILTATSF